MTKHAIHDRHNNASSIFNVENIAKNGEYLEWRAQKLADYPTNPNELMVSVANLDAPTHAERDLIRTNCARTNLSFYRTTTDPQIEQNEHQQNTRKHLNNFAKAFGLTNTEAHRSAGDDGIVALEVTANSAQAGYIPYTNRRLSWHTDGYYNYHGESHAIRAMLMHCVRSAEDGGENAYLDPHIAFIRLRDENPEYIKALMDPAAMTIPENQEENGKLRPTNTGPVFFIDDQYQLNMRYTARTRNIIWKSDTKTTEAVAFLNQALKSDPLIIRYRLGKGEGVICNNVLHNRTGFDKEEQNNSKRLIYRARYYQRIK